MRRRKFLAIVLTLCLVFGMTPITGSAAGSTASGFPDISGHWAENQIVKWAGLGLVSGDSRGFRPNEPITRAEMASVLDNLMGYQTAAENSFSDVPASAWYAEDVLKANGAGILLGDTEGHAFPEANITREQAAAMLARAFAVDDGTKAGSAFKDAASVSSWAAGAVFGMEEYGYIGGMGDGTFAPKANVTRAQIVTMIDSAVKAYYIEAGTYTDDVEASTSGGHCVAIVKASGVIIKDAVVRGDLIVAEGVADGDFTLDGTEVTGELIARGGGENSIHITGTSKVQNIRIERVDGKIRVVAEDGTEIGVVTVDGNDDVIIEGEVGTVTVVAENVVVTATKADIVSAEIQGDNSKIIVGSGSTVGSMQIDGKNAQITVQAGSTVSSVVINGEGATVGGSGKVDEVRANANDIKVTTPNTNVTAGAGASGITAGQKEVTSGDTKNTGGNNNGGGTSSITVTGLAYTDASTFSFTSVQVDSLKFDDENVGIVTTTGGVTTSCAIYANGGYTVYLADPAAVGTHTLTLTKTGYTDVTAAADYVGTIEKAPQTLITSAAIATVSGKTITFTGEIPFIYEHEYSPWNDSAHRVGVRINAPAGMTAVSAAAIVTTPDGTGPLASSFYPVGDDYFDYYFVTNTAGDTFAVSVKWTGAAAPADTYTIIVGATASYEAADKTTNGSRSQAVAIATDGTAYEEYIFPNSDIDWYKFTASAGATYLLRTSNLWDNAFEDGDYLDTYIFLYDSNSNELLGNDDYDYATPQADNLSSGIEYTFAQAGTYYVKVLAYDFLYDDELLGDSEDYYYGKYDFSVTNIPGTRTATPTIVTDPIEIDASTVTGTAIAGSTVCIAMNQGKGWYETYTTASGLGVWEYGSSFSGGETIVVMAKEAGMTMSYPVTTTVETLEVTALTDADVTVQEGSIEFVYEFNVSGAAVTYQEAKALEGPYYLDDDDSSVTISGTTTSGAVATPITKRLDQLLLDTTGTAVYADAAAFSASTGVNFIPNQITINLVGATSVNNGDDEWELEAVVNLSNAELVLFDPPLPANVTTLDGLKTTASAIAVTSGGIYTTASWMVFSAAWAEAEDLPELLNSQILIKIEAIENAIALLVEAVD